MNELSIFERHGKLYADSREVAEVAGQRHRDLLRTIRHYVDVMQKSNGRNIAPADYFRASTFKNIKAKVLQVSALALMTPGLTA